ncbi:MAG: FHA domain-containing protein [Oscillospiraceae bacterium]
MTKYKICPNCNCHNEPNIPECVQCEADITSVPVVDEETVKHKTETYSQKRMVRICDECGAVNPPAARICSCGEDISDIIPIEQQEESTKQGQAHFTLATIDGNYAYDLTEPETTVGKENTMSEYLSGKPYVSRVHAKLTIQDGGLFVIDLGSTNHTYVNNEQVIERQELHDGDELALGGRVVNNSRQDGAAYFMVRICM